MRIVARTRPHGARHTWNTVLPLAGRETSKSNESEVISVDDKREETRFIPSINTGENLHGACLPMQISRAAYRTNLTLIHGTDPMISDTSSSRDATETKRIGHRSRSTCGMSAVALMSLSRSIHLSRAGSLTVTSLNQCSLARSLLLSIDASPDICLRFRHDRLPLHLRRFLHYGTRQDDLQRWDSMNVLQMLIFGRDFASLLLLVIFRAIDTLVALLHGEVLMRRHGTSTVGSLF